MGEAVLVESQVADAVALVRKLDAQGDAPNVAAWQLRVDDDGDDWRLIIAGSTFDAALHESTVVAYLKLAQVIATLDLAYLTGANVQIVNSTSVVTNSIREMVATSPSAITRKHVGGSLINGIFIKEMIVLRAA